MKDPEEMRKADFERLKGLIGEENARIYFNKDNYNVKAVGVIFLFFRIKAIAVKRPILFLFILIIVLSFLGAIIYSKFHY